MYEPSIYPCKLINIAGYYMYFFLRIRKRIFFYLTNITVDVYNHEFVKAFVTIYAKYRFSEFKANIKICKFSPN